MIHYRDAVEIAEELYPRGGGPWRLSTAPPARVTARGNFRRVLVCCRRGECSREIAGMIWLHELDPSADGHRSAAQTVGVGPCLPTIQALSCEGLNHKPAAPHGARKPVPVFVRNDLYTLGHSIPLAQIAM
jgi:hypothetical protein